MPEDLNYTQLYEYNILLDDIIEKLSTIQNANEKASNIKFFTQEDVARVTGMSKSTVKNYSMIQNFLRVITAKLT